MPTSQCRVRPTKEVSRTTSPAQAKNWFVCVPFPRLCRGRLPQNWDIPSPWLARWLGKVWTAAMQPGPRPPAECADAILQEAWASDRIDGGGKRSV